MGDETPDDDQALTEGDRAEGLEATAMKGADGARDTAQVRTSTQDAMAPAMKHIRRWFRANPEASAPVLIGLVVSAAGIFAMVLALSFLSHKT